MTRLEPNDQPRFRIPADIPHNLGMGNTGFIPVACIRLSAVDFVHVPNFTRLIDLDERAASELSSERLNQAEWYLSPRSGNFCPPSLH